MPAVKKKVSKEVKVSKVSKVVIVAAAKKTPSRGTALSIPVYSLAGRAMGTLSLPKEIFGQKINKHLLAQAVRVYTTNQKIFTAHTKTRGEVKGSTAKIYRQKGTGRARHGSIRAPIFVGGGIVFGPRVRKVRLNLPQRMKRKALISALSAKLIDKKIMGLSGLDKVSGKTREVANLLQKLAIGNALIVTSEKQDKVVRAARNIKGVSVLPANLINAYDVLRHHMLLLTREAADKLEFKRKKQS